MPKPKLTCPACAARGRQCNECKNARKRETYQKKLLGQLLCEKCGKPRPIRSKKYCTPCRREMEKGWRIAYNKRIAAEARAERLANPQPRNKPGPKPGSKKVVKEKPKPVEKPPKPAPTKIKVDENRHGSGVVLYHGLAANKNRKKVERRKIKKLKVSELHRRCCGRNYTLVRRFWAGAEVAFLVAHRDGAEYRACPRCNTMAMDVQKLDTQPRPV